MHLWTYPFLRATKSRSLAHDPNPAREARCESKRSLRAKDRAITRRQLRALKAQVQP